MSETTKIRDRGNGQYAHATDRPCRCGHALGKHTAAVGEGATVRCGDLVVWTEGSEEQTAYESYDDAAMTMRDRAKTAGLL